VRTPPKLAINRGDHFKLLLVQVLGVDLVACSDLPAGFCG